MEMARKPSRTMRRKPAKSASAGKSAAKVKSLRTVSRASARKSVAVRKPATARKLPAARKTQATRAAAKAPALKPTLYGIWLSGPTYKVGLALSLMGVPFSYVHLDLREGAHKTPEYIELNRYGQVPCLVDGKRALCQSASILEYLAERTGKLSGKSAADKIRVREWMFWEFDRLAPPVYRMRAIRRGLMQGTPEIEQMFTTNAKLAFDVLDKHLAGRDWLVGKSPTIADVDLYGVVAYAGEAGYDLSGYANVTAWIARLQGLKGFGAHDALLPKESRA
jgi:glutathione S-transferase